MAYTRRPRHRHHPMPPSSDHSDLDQALDGFARVLEMMNDRQAELEQGFARWRQLALISFALLVGSLSLMVVLLSQQLPAVTVTIDTMNRHFTSITDDMGFMRRSMAAMDQYVQAMPTMLQHIDDIHADVTAIGGDVGAMNAQVATITQNLDQVTTGVVDMRQSFQIMDASVDRMTHDVKHMSKPMRWFNSINPFR